MKLRPQVKRTATVDGTEATFTFTKRDYPRYESDATGRRRGYWTTTRQDYSKKPRVYVETSGETLLDNLVNRTTRPANVWGRALRKAMAALELPGKVNWSQRAGCSCGCSPGFVWTDAPFMEFTTPYGVEKSDRYDVYVSLTGVPAKRTDPEAELVQAGRGRALAADPTLPLDLMAGTVLS